MEGRSLEVGLTQGANLVKVTAERARAGAVEMDGLKEGQRREERELAQLDGGSWGWKEEGGT